MPLAIASCFVTCCRCFFAFASSAQDQTGIQALQEAGTQVPGMNSLSDDCPAALQEYKKRQPCWPTPSIHIYKPDYSHASLHVSALTSNNKRTDSAVDALIQSRRHRAAKQAERSLCPRLAGIRGPFIGLALT